MVPTSVFKVFRDVSINYYQREEQNHMVEISWNLCDGHAKPSIALSWHIDDNLKWSFIPPYVPTDPGG